MSFVPMLTSAHREFLKTLSNPNRVALMLLLLKGPMTVTEIVAKSGMEQSTVSHHLRRLKLCEFVRNRANGKERIYSVNEETAGPLFRLMDKHVKKYCQRVCLAGHSTTCPSKPWRSGKCDGRCPSSPL